MNRPTPLLSICIPTYNRAHLLGSALRALLPQVEALGGAVEVVVSDNCSPDDTPAVAKRAEEWGPLRYHRHERNLGATKNILVLCNELARGEFAWVLGDDDLVRPGGVKRVLDALEAHPEIDYVFVNTTYKSAAEFPAFNRQVSEEDFPDLQPAKAGDLTDRYVERWEELLDPEVDDVFLGSLMCSVFRLSRWRAYTLREPPAGGEPFTTLESSYPHTVVLAHTMIGRKAYYVGYPCSVTFQGGQEWLGYLPLLLLVRLQELLDLYAALGVGRSRVEKCRRSLLNKSFESRALHAMLLNPGTPGRRHFSLRRFARRNRHHAPLLGVMLASVLRDWVPQSLPKPLHHALRGVKRKTLQALGRR